MAEQTLKIGVAIPCFIKHINLLKRVLDSIENQTRKPDQVIVSCSEASDADIPYRQSDYSYPLQIITYTEVKSGSENRNIAASRLTTDIISFFDADDVMHPQRLECIEACFTTNPDATTMLHQFQLGSQTVAPFYYEFNVFKNNVFSIEYNIKAGNNMYARLKATDESVNDFHNGHVTIRREAFDSLKFNELGPVIGCEDAVFTGNLYEKYGPSKIYYAPYKLTYYEPQQTLILRHIDLFYKDHPQYRELRSQIEKDVWPSCAKN